MRKLCLMVPLAAVATALLVPALGSAQVEPPAFAPKNCSTPKVAPKRIVIACGDGNFFIDNLKWDTFESSKATGSGRAYINDCRSNCAAGSFDSYKVDVVLSKVKEQKCGGSKTPLFTKIIVTYTGKKPKESDGTDPYPLFCIP